MKKIFFLLGFVLFLGMGANAQELLSSGDAIDNLKAEYATLTTASATMSSRLSTSASTFDGVKQAKRLAIQNLISLISDNGNDFSNVDTALGQLNFDRLGIDAQGREDLEAYLDGLISMS